MTQNTDLQSAKGRVIDAIDATLLERLASGRDAHEVRCELANRFAVALEPTNNRNSPNAKPTLTIAVYETATASIGRASSGGESGRRSSR